METFTGYGNFEKKLEFGNRLENLVQRKLKEKKYDVRLTPQGWNERDPKLGNIDTILYVENNPVVGIECKLMKEPFRISPYGDNNIPLNKSSIDTYMEVKFRVYILVGQMWTGDIFVAPLNEVISSPHTIMNTKYKDTPIYNFDGSKWYKSKSLKNCLDYIIKSSKPS